MVYLDAERPRICVKGKEENAAEERGYECLPDGDIFPFFEMRAAAVDLRTDAEGNKRSPEEMTEAFDRDELRRRIRAQLETLKRNSMRHVVLSAFGCGAFSNPTHEVARLYMECLHEYAEHFDIVAFAIFWPGFGPRDNYDVFEAAFRDF